MESLRVNTPTSALHRTWYIVVPVHAVLYYYVTPHVAYEVVWDPVMEEWIFSYLSRHGQGWYWRKYYIVGDV